MKPMIKAIQTKYKGYRFRSRLEARWAVFFDACGIPWQYETEGFVLKNGEAYLPDFYFPNEGLYAEVKADSGDFTKARLFCETTQNQIVLLEGLPELKYYDTYTYDDENEVLSEDNFRVFFDVYVRGGAGSCFLNHEGPDAAWWDRTSIAWMIMSYAGYVKDYASMKLLDEGFKTIETATHKAKGARFEFGEKG